jgi:hypothetical protein
LPKAYKIKACGFFCGAMSSSRNRATRSLY